MDKNTLKYKLIYFFKDLIAENYIIAVLVVFIFSGLFIIDTQIPLFEQNIFENISGKKVSSFYVIIDGENETIVSQKRDNMVIDNQHAFEGISYLISSIIILFFTGIFSGLFTLIYEVYKDFKYTNMINYTYLKDKNTICVSYTKHKKPKIIELPYFRDSQWIDQYIKYIKREN